MKKLFQYVLLSSAVLCCLHTHAQYNSLLWKISGNKLKAPSYLYGTMHTKDARAFAFGDSVLPFFAKSKVYAMELNPDEMLNMGLITKLMMGKGMSLQKMIPEKEYAVLDSIVKKSTGFSVYVFDNIAPVFTAMMVDMAAMGLNDSSIEGNDKALDIYFHKLAQQQNKKTIGIETIDEQLGALNSLSFEEQAELLVESIREYGEMKKEGGDLIRFYQEGNLDSLAAMGTESDMPEKLYRALLSDRNVRMADRVDPMIRKKSTFIAVGALHLPGKDGVIELLRKKGYRVEAVR